jgi:hypothetical protein
MGDAKILYAHEHFEIVCFRYRSLCGNLRKECYELKGGGKPPFPTLRLLNFLDCLTLKAVQGEITISTLIRSR